ncbi:MAG: MBL fold metallo-hydrolase [Gemmatimonadetes bacterium]|nr:MBL fold metallo-hydrolase [Gemmatimonadota bacterium]
MPTIRAGQYTIASVVTGWARLDGGAMFGVVPKVLWAKGEDCDDSNRILLATRTLIAAADDGSRVVLVDTGVGSKWLPEDAERYAVEHREGSIRKALHALGRSQGDVTDVIATHLHFDHAGGMTRFRDETRADLALVFPGATHWVHRRHWDHALSPTLRDRASFFPHDFKLLEDSGHLEFVEGDDPACPIPGVEWSLSHGHTPYQLLPLFEDEASPLFFTGDLVPTASHLPPAWVMAYDLYPLKTLNERLALYERVSARNLRIAFPHDRRMGGARLSVDGNRVRVEEPLLVNEH